MIIKHKIIKQLLQYPLEKSYDLDDSSTLNKPYNLNELAFFDIETTGFSADSSYLYLIGCMYYSDDSWHLTQWLAEDISSEKDIILEFTKTIMNVKKLIHFNGTTFDIPYINRKCKALGLINPFLGKESYDIYKEIFPLKKLLPVSNLKLTTLETFVGVNREDTHSGSDLIQVYTNFIGKLQYEKLKALNTSSIQDEEEDNLHQSDYSYTLDKEGKSFNPPDNSYIPAKELERILFLHNEEDIKSLIPISTLLHIKDLLKQSIPKDVTINYNTNSLDCYSTFCINLSLPYKLPYCIRWTYPLGSLLSDTVNNHNTFASTLLEINIMNSQLVLTIPMFTGTLKYFFNNYKDYYYLPVEDTAIHKSVAEYVDKEYRAKATKANCYTKKYGTFIPFVLHSYQKNNHKDKNNYPSNSFFFNYEDKLYFMEFTNELFVDLEILETYIKNILNLFMNKEITTMKVV